MSIDVVVLWLLALGALAGFGVWALKRYKLIQEGGITLNEITEAIEDAAEKAEEVIDAVEEAVDATKKE